jgi:probable HAF family extracellular repeat protein
MVGLGDLTGEGLGTSKAYSVSANGDTVVGYSSTGAAAGGITELEIEAFRWTEATGMVGLGDLPGGAYLNYARGVSGSGAVIVGYSNTDLGWVPFVWTESQGMRHLVDVLNDDYGLDVGQWVLQYAWGVSDDGLVIVGSGINPEGNQEGWVVCLRDECFEDDDDDDHGGKGHQHHGDKGKGHQDHGEGGKGHRHHDHEDD